MSAIAFCGSCFPIPLYLDFQPFSLFPALMQGAIDKELSSCQKSSLTIICLGVISWSMFLVPQFRILLWLEGITHVRLLDSSTRKVLDDRCILASPDSEGRFSHCNMEKIPFSHFMWSELWGLLKDFVLWVSKCLFVCLFFWPCFEGCLTWVVLLCVAVAKAPQHLTEKLFFS